MRLSTITSTSLSLSTTLATPLPLPPKDQCTCDPQPPAFFLSGDSTTAINGGWGNGFLSFLQPPAWGINYGHSGRTTESFVAGGDWTKVLASVRNNTAVGLPSYVTIQFGHNDQKEAAGISITQFQSNLQNLAEQVKAAGGTPVLVTPLTRRTFEGNGTVVESLAAERAATIAAAKGSKVHYVDLNGASTAYVNALGKDRRRRVIWRRGIGRI